ncbi:hypothetical protein CSUI_007744 [Cystoisospora suis]|uniref:Uncharacterized protein n=1 Tax=Cystoisospora suis TaxID=483139 RepID=A0A2C6KP88_9APIC|nr:hypothetical protein CSUI_007744 [Cystoisospora suis]
MRRVFISWILIILSGGWDAKQERDSQVSQCPGAWAPRAPHFVVVKGADTSGSGSEDEASTSRTGKAFRLHSRSAGRPRKRRKPSAPASSRGLPGLAAKRQRRRRQRQSTSTQAPADGGQATPPPSPGWAERHLQVSPLSEQGDGGFSSETEGTPSTSQPRATVPPLVGPPYSGASALVRASLQTGRGPSGGPAPCPPLQRYPDPQAASHSSQPSGPQGLGGTLHAGEETPPGDKEELLATIAEWLAEQSPSEESTGSGVSQAQYHASPPTSVGPGASPPGPQPLPPFTSHLSMDPHGGPQPLPPFTSHVSMDPSGDPHSLLSFTSHASMDPHGGPQPPPPFNSLVSMDPHGGPQPLPPFTSHVSMDRHGAPPFEQFVSQPSDLSSGQQSAVASTSGASAGPSGGWPHGPSSSFPESTSSQVVAVPSTSGYSMQPTDGSQYGLDTSQLGVPVAQGSAPPFSSQAMVPSRGSPQDQYMSFPHLPADRQGQSDAFSAALQSQSLYDPWFSQHDPSPSQSSSGSSTGPGPYAGGSSSGYPVSQPAPWPEQPLSALPGFPTVSSPESSDSEEGTNGASTSRQPGPSQPYDQGWHPSRGGTGVWRGILSSPAFGAMHHGDGRGGYVARPTAGVPGVRWRQLVRPGRAPLRMGVPQQALDAVRRQPTVPGTLVMPSPSEEGTTSSSSGSTRGAAGPSPAPPTRPPGPYLTTWEPGSGQTTAFGLLTLRPVASSGSSPGSPPNRLEPMLYFSAEPVPRLLLVRPVGPPEPGSPPHAVSSTGILTFGPFYHGGQASRTSGQSQSGSSQQPSASDQPLDLSVRPRSRSRSPAPRSRSRSPRPSANVPSAPSSRSASSSSPGAGSSVRMVNLDSIGTTQNAVTCD